MDLIVRSFVENREPEDKVYALHEIGGLAKAANSRRGDSGSGQTDASRPPKEIAFVTGNEQKVRELEQNFQTDSIRFTVIHLDLPEIQHQDILSIVEEKCKCAYRLVNGLASNNNEHCQAEPGSGCHGAPIKVPHRSVLIEDTCLNFKALNGLPGPYIKWFLKAIGANGLPRLLADYKDKSAEAVCIYALMEDESSMVFCRGLVDGRITTSRGSDGWGWDSVFEEQRSGLTFAEMSSDMKSKFSQRSSAIRVLKEYLFLV